MNASSIGLRHHFHIHKKGFASGAVALNINTYRISQLKKWVTVCYIKPALGVNYMVQSQPSLGFQPSGWCMKYGKLYKKTYSSFHKFKLFSYIVSMRQYCTCKRSITLCNSLTLRVCLLIGRVQLCGSVMLELNCKFFGASLMTNG